MFKQKKHQTPDGMQEEKERSYRAFISYSHKDKKKVARLQKKLETSRIPRSFRRNANISEKRIYPVFRDDTDLTGVALMDSIRHALAHSDYLIVICTPNSAASGYVNAEVDCFVETGRADRIVPVVIDKKSPYESYDEAWFPPSLLAAGYKPQDAIVYAGASKRGAIYRLIYRLLGLTDKVYLEKYIDRRLTVGNVAMALLVPVVWFYALVIGVDVTRELRTAHYYYESMAFKDGLRPDGVEQLSRPLPDNYYAVSFRLSDKHYLYRVEHIGIDSASQPFSMTLLESERMDYCLNQNTSNARTSKIKYYNAEGELLFVKNYSLNQEIVDLIMSDDSPEPYYLPYDMTSEKMGGKHGFSCRIAQGYDEKGRLAMVYYLSDSVSNLMVCDSNGYYGHRYERREDGSVSAVVYIDEQGNEMARMAVK